jgi:hypothetical protein
MFSGIKGRGPGSGVRASPETVFPLLLSVLITDNLSEIDQRVKQLATVMHRTGDCKLTGSRSFGGAILEILSSVELASRVREITVQREHLEGWITWNERRRGYVNSRIERFGIGPAPSFPARGLTITAALDGKSIHHIAAKLALLNEEEPDQ